MSHTEINRGTLTPDLRLPSVIAESAVSEFLDCYVSKLEAFLDDPEYYGYVSMSGRWYILEKHSCEEATQTMCELNVSCNGQITFFTMHYNGGGDWTEVVEDRLKEKYA
jgi:hypothetical protein